MSSWRRALGHESSIVPARLIYGPGARPTPQLERRFFAGIRMPNGTFKSTYDRRLDDLNEAIAAHLPTDRPLKVKDVAVSSGISTLEWCESLTRAGIEFGMTATDIVVHAHLVAARGRLWVLVRDGGPLQIDVGGYAFRLDQIGRRERLMYGVPIAIARRPRLLRALTISESPVELVSPRLSDAVDVLEEDILDPAPGRWDVVRAANILNRGYFPAPVLRSMIARLVAAVAPGGLFAVCRTVPQLGNQASIFELTPDGPRAVGELNGGSEVAELVTQAHVPASR